MSARHSLLCIRYPGFHSEAAPVLPRALEGVVIRVLTWVLPAVRASIPRPPSSLYNRPARPSALRRFVSWSAAPAHATRAAPVSPRRRAQEQALLLRLEAANRLKNEKDAENLRKERRNVHAPPKRARAHTRTL